MAGKGGKLPLRRSGASSTGRSRDAIRTATNPKRLTRWRSEIERDLDGLHVGPVEPEGGDEAGNPLRDRRGAVVNFRPGAVSAQLTDPEDPDFVKVDLAVPGEIELALLDRDRANLRSLR